ncbi:hypothetical protein H4R19_002998, partial [Coemansia spiralis]
MSSVQGVAAFSEASSLSDCISATLESLVTAHSQGPETTIYADATALQTINASFADGVLGVIAGGGSGCRARNVKLLGQIDNGSAAGLADGSHVLFLVGAASWPQTAWPEVAQTLRGTAYASCTLCVATPEATWGDVAAAWPPRDDLRQPLNRSGVVAALAAAMRQGQRGSALEEARIANDTVAVVTAPLLAAMPLADDLFVTPDASHIFPAIAQKEAAGGARQQIEQLALNLASVVRGLGLRGSFYSLGDTARRTARRCAGISQNVDSAGAADGLRDAVVVLVDRTADLVAPMRHGGHLLDDMYRALPPLPAAGSDRLVIAPDVPDSECDSELPAILPGQSLLGLLRPCQQGSADRQPSVDLWEAMLMQDRPVALQVLRSGLARGLASSDTAVAPELTRGRATAEQLQALADACRSRPQAMAECGSLVEAAQAVVSTERAAQDGRWKEIEGAEKTLALVIGGIKDALADARVPSDNDNDDGAADDDEICAAWDQVLAAIPPLVPAMVESCIQAGSELRERVPEQLWRHTPAPGMILMAA